MPARPKRKARCSVRHGAEPFPDRDTLLAIDEQRPERVVPADAQKLIRDHKSNSNPFATGVATFFAEPKSR